MGGSLSCHYCGHDISKEELLSDGGDFNCPSCGATAMD